MIVLIKDEKGLTLIEVLVAMTILSLIILTSLTLLGNGFGVSAINNDKSQAVNIAEEQIERWKHDLAQNGWNGTGVLYESPVTLSGKTFSVKVTAAEWDGTPAGLGEVKFVNLTVRVWVKDVNNPEALLETLVKVDGGT